MGVINLTNQTFGLLKVLYRDLEPHNRKGAWWICECECGNKKSILGSELRRGRTKSCGCLSKQQAKENLKIAQLKNLNSSTLIGKKFGKLIVIQELSEKQNGYRLWKCKCDCGNLTIANTNILNKGHKMSCGCLQSKGEMIIASILQQNNIQYEHQKTFNDCRFNDTQALAKFDFYVENKYIIEYDGVQHFTYTNNDWNTKQHFEKTLEHDMFKNKWCKEKNISIIRIPYWKYDTLTLEDLILETSKFVINS